MGSHERLRVVLLWSLISSFKTLDAFWCHKHACVCWEWIAGTTLALWICLACAEVSMFVWMFHDSFDFILFHDAGSFFDLPFFFVYIGHHRHHHQHPHHHPPNHRLGSLATCFWPRSCRSGISAWDMGMVRNQCLPTLPSRFSRRYGWWKKSCTKWYGKYPSFCRVVYIHTGFSFVDMMNPRKGVCPFVVGHEFRQLLMGVATPACKVWPGKSWALKRPKGMFVLQIFLNPPKLKIIYRRPWGKNRWRRYQKVG